MPGTPHLLRHWFGKAEVPREVAAVQLTAQGTAAAPSAPPAAVKLALAKGAFVAVGTAPDRELTQRIKRAYRLAIGASHGAGKSMWAGIGQRNAAIHEALLADDDRLQTILENPGQHDLFYGFHSLFASRTRELRAATEEQRQSMTDALGGEIVRLGEALGVRRLRNPESKGATAEVEEVETALAGIDEALGVRVSFPNPHVDEFGIVTSRGIASYRAIHALYQANRLKQLARIHGERIVEIGAGLGRTICYAYEWGLRQSTIVDLPMTNVAQASFLGQTLGPGAITLLGEEPAPGKIRIVTGDWLRECKEDFDIVLNVDSMTEMDREYAEEYAAFFQARAKCFLSINHDANRFRVCELGALKGLRAGRFPYWMREGYAEEIYSRPGSA